MDVWHPKPTNARMIWQRSRMVYPFLEVAHRAWLNATGVPLGSLGPSDCNDVPDDAAEAFDSYYDDDDDFPFEVQCGQSASEENAAAIGELLNCIARASPEEKVLNSLLYARDQCAISRMCMHASPCPMVD